MALFGADGATLAPLAIQADAQLADGETARRWTFDHVLLAIDATMPEA